MYKIVEIVGIVLRASPREVARISILRGTAGVATAEGAATATNPLTSRWVDQRRHRQQHAWSKGPRRQQRHRPAHRRYHARSCRPRGALRKRSSTMAPKATSDSVVECGPQMIIKVGTATI